MYQKCVWLPTINCFLSNVTLLHFLPIKLNLSLTFVPPGCQKILISTGASDLSWGRRKMGDLCTARKGAMPLIFNPTWQPLSLSNVQWFRRERTPLLQGPEKQSLALDRRLSSRLRFPLRPHHQLWVLWGMGPGVSSSCATPSWALRNASFSLPVWLSCNSFSHCIISFVQLKRLRAKGNVYS